MAQGLKVIGAGFGRTGTLSLKAALERLGFGPCYHMIETFGRPDHTVLWNRAAQGEEVDWRRIFVGFQATVDWPGCAFYEQLMMTFPQARVILTIREPEAWYESICQTIARRPSAQLDEPVHDMQAQMVRSVIWKGSLRGLLHDKEAAIDIYEAHIKAVQALVPPLRLLRYDIREGWQPLCDFLDVDVPNDLFPHLNDRYTYNDRTAFRRLVAERTA